MRAAGLALCLGAQTAYAAAPLGVAAGDVNCTGTLPGGVDAKYACLPPFSCNTPSTKTGKQAATDDGHADFSFWCGTPQYLDPAIRCQQGNITGYGIDIYPVQQNTTGVPDIDCQYCMEIGHCGYSDDSPYPQSGEVTEDTTLAEMEALCDARWGHDAWTKLTAVQALAELGLAVVGGTLKKFGAVAMSKLSCASGNYHCDAMYCREIYCKKPEYAKWLYLRPNKTTP